VEELQQQLQQTTIGNAPQGHKILIA
jgi:hypothetical protein